MSADAAKRLFAFYKTMPERALAGDLGTAGKLAVRAFANLIQSRLTRARPAELIGRSKAFADAAGEAGAIETTATMDALQNCIGLVGRFGLGPFAGLAKARMVEGAIPACSTAIAWGRATHDGELIFARNFDFPGVGVWDAAPAFVTCAPDRGQRYGFFTSRGADTPVVTVVNEAGLVMAPHTRFHRDITAMRGAMIVDLVHEIARKAETLEDAIRIAREMPASSSWGIAIGSAREKSAIVLEIAGPQLAVIRPTENYLVCANRYRTPALQERELAASEAWAIHSDRRQCRLEALLAANVVTPEQLVAFMGDRTTHLGSNLSQLLNVHCAVVTPAKLQALVGVDRAPACRGQWEALTWTWDGAFTTEPRDLAPPHDAADAAIYEASQAYDNHHDTAGALAAIERAVAAAPDDPSLRQAAAWLALELGRAERAIAQTEAGLVHETERYRRGQLLAWGVRAAHRKNPALAKRWRAELDRLDLPELSAIAARRGRPHINLMMADAY
ncbi:MAG: C45 family autoproteolytic acyltransferase/hydrolase [Kofleriaceae bacterium]